MSVFRSLALGMMLLTTVPAMAMNTEVVELYYRSATEMSAVIQQHLSPGETVSGLDNKLVLRIKPENRTAIMALIKQLDKRPSQLLVSVRQGGEQTQNRSEAGVSGRYQRGSGAVQIGDDPRPLSARVVESSGRSSSNASQQLRVMDGQAATFHVGQLVPVPGGSTITPGGYVLHDGIYYQEVTTGFIVRPRMRGEQVLLEISPQRQSYNADGTISTQSINTTVEAGLGQWTEIGSVVEQMNQQNRGLLSSRKTAGSNNSSVQIKVDRSN